MNNHVSHLLASLSIFALSGCTFFQGIESTTNPVPPAPSAQEIISQAINTLYNIHSGSLVENFDLYLHRNTRASDHWTATIRENWRDQPAQSIADMHITLAVTDDDSASSTQGILNITSAKDANRTKFIKLNTVHFSGTDGHLLDTIVEQWLDQWFSLPENIQSIPQLSWYNSIIATIDNFKSLPKEQVVGSKYFRVQEAQEVQMSEEVAHQLTVSLDQEGIAAFLARIPAENANPLLSRLITSSTFEGRLYIGKNSHYLRKVDGTLQIQSPNDAAQKMVIQLRIEMNHINENVPVAIPSQHSPLPSALLDQAIENKVLE